MCTPDVCLPLMPNHTNVAQQGISNSISTKDLNLDGKHYEQHLFLSCPDDHVLYNAGMVQKYKGITDGETDKNTTLGCEKIEDIRYWKTSQGGKLLYPNCKPMPGCNCLKGEM